MFDKDSSLIYERYLVLLDSFKTPSDMFSDPANNDRTFDEMLKQLKQEGGSVIGRGKQGTVLKHPDWPYIIKFFSSDDSYIRFVRFVNKNPHVCFPKFYGNPQLIVPNFKRTSEYENLYLVRMEYIPFEIKSKEDEDFIIDELAQWPNYFSEESHPYGKNEDYYVHMKQYERMMDIKQKRPDLVRLSNCFDILRSAGLFNDIHENNIRQREDGEFVVIDPAWNGVFNPEVYRRELIDRETGDFSYEDEAQKPQIAGGKRVDYRKAKREKLKREKEYQKSRTRDRDIPF